MKQIWMMVVVGLLLIGFSSLAFTQEHKADMMNISKDMKQGDKICQEKMTGIGHGCEMMRSKSLLPQKMAVLLLCVAINFLNTTKIWYYKKR